MAATPKKYKIVYLLGVIALFGGVGLTVAGFWNAPNAAGTLAVGILLVIVSVPTLLLNRAFHWWHHR